MPRGLSQSQRTLIEKARNPGSSDMAVALSDADCAFLILTIARDLQHSELFPMIDLESVPAYFSVEPVTQNVAQLPVIDEALASLFAAIPDSDTYFSCLASLHKSRLKYDQILKRQPYPTFDQVGPRGLLQFGTLSPKGLITLLFWRKWIYDVDNRAAQDTGYLFEPILAHAIGGVPVSARRSPVKRRSDPSKGRQVDCLRQQRAYEFKIRLTIAASGQGRWGEELDFPDDCHESGYQPVLVVLDPTPNPKLRELRARFLAVGGECFVGDPAWEHLEEEAGATMGVFLENYVRGPMNSLLAESHGPMADFSLGLRQGGVELRIGEESMLVHREVEGAHGDEAELPDDIDAELPGV